MSFARCSSPSALSRRGFLGAGAAMFAGVLVSGATAQELQFLHRRRPGLPGMGPSYRTEVAYAGDRPAGSITIVAEARTLDLVLGAGRAYRYAISVGRDGFGWSGRVTVGAKKEWPEWRPPQEMRQRQPGLPELVPPGPYNPLGARALYLHRDGRDTLYRIHGTNDPQGIGFDNTSGCFRMTNTDIKELFDLVSLGATVDVL